MRLVFMWGFGWGGLLRWSWRDGRRLGLEVGASPLLTTKRDIRRGFRTLEEHLSRTQGRSGTFIIESYWA